MVKVIGKSQFNVEAVKALGKKGFLQTHKHLGSNEALSNLYIEIIGEKAKAPPQDKE